MWRTGHSGGVATPGGPAGSNPFLISKTRQEWRTDHGVPLKSTWFKGWTALPNLCGSSAISRMAQEKPEVRVLTFYGRDNAIDGVILDVLLRKHKSIKSDPGVSVSVPGSSEEVTEALFERALLREMTGGPTYQAAGGSSARGCVRHSPGRATRARNKRNPGSVNCWTTTTGCWRAWPAVSAVVFVTWTSAPLWDGTIGPTSCTRQIQGLRASQNASMPFSKPSSRPLKVRPKEEAVSWAPSPS